MMRLVSHWVMWEEDAKHCLIYSVHCDRIERTVEDVADMVEGVELHEVRLERIPHGEAFGGAARHVHARHLVPPRLRVRKAVAHAAERRHRRIKVARRWRRLHKAKHR